MASDPIVQQLREARRATGMKQCALARATGLSQATISQIEVGRRGASLLQVRLIAAVLGFDLDLRSSS